MDESFSRDHLEGPDFYCVFAICTPQGETIGFCTLEPFIGTPTFAATAEVMYFIHPQHTGRGAGSAALQKLEAEAVKRGVRLLVADISTENEDSIRFHEKLGFSRYGCLQDAGCKFGRRFGIVYLSKRLAE